MHVYFTSCMSGLDVIIVLRFECMFFSRMPVYATAAERCGMYARADAMHSAMQGVLMCLGQGHKGRG